MHNRMRRDLFGAMFGRFPARTLPAGGGGGPADPPPVTDPPKATDPAADPPNPADPPKVDPPANETAEQKIIRLEAGIAAARKEAGNARTTAKANAAKEARDALMKEISVALGLKDPDKVTPEELEKALAASKSETDSTKGELHTTKIELAVYRLGSKAGGNPDALLDSRTFLASVKDLDPSDKDFDTKLTDAVKAAVEKNASLKGSPGAGRSGGEFPGGTGATNGRPPSMSSAITAHYNQS